MTHPTPPSAASDDTPQPTREAGQAPPFRSIRGSAEAAGRLRSEELQTLLQKSAAIYPPETLDRQDPDAEDHPLPCP